MSEVWRHRPINADVLRRLMSERGYNMAALAYKSQYSHAHIYEALRDGKPHPRLTNVLALILEVSRDELTAVAPATVAS